jgi:hypothetical protein
MEGAVGRVGDAVAGRAHAGDGEGEKGPTPIRPGGGGSG